jgi:hypothetical protein
MLINRRVGDDAGQSLLDSRAFTPEAWAALLGHLQAQPPDASRARMLFILTFVEATGLRAAELVGATMGACVSTGALGAAGAWQGGATVWWRFPGRPATPCRITCWPAAWVHWDIRRPRHLCWRA